MPYLLSTILLLGALCLAPFRAEAQPPNTLLLTKSPKTFATVLDGVTLDTPHISAVFWIRHIVAPVAGRFDVVAGTMDIPAKNPEKGRVAFSVKTASVNTGVPERDAHLNTADFLDSEAYPDMKFVSERIESGGKDIYNVSGKLTIKDVTKMVTIPVKVLGTKPHPTMPCVDVTGYESTFPLNRLDYHVGTGKYFRMGALGDTVDIRLAGETLAPQVDCVKAQ